MSYYCSMILRILTTQKTGLFLQLQICLNENSSTNVPHRSTGWMNPFWQLHYFHYSRDCVIPKQGTQSQGNKSDDDAFSRKQSTGDFYQSSAHGRYLIMEETGGMPYASRTQPHTMASLENTLVFMKQCPMVYLQKQRLLIYYNLMFICNKEGRLPHTTPRLSVVKQQLKCF